MAKRNKVSSEDFKYGLASEVSFTPFLLEAQVAMVLCENKAEKCLEVDVDAKFNLINHLAFNSESVLRPHKGLPKAPPQLGFLKVYD